MANEEQIVAKTENLDRIVGDFQSNLNEYLKNMNQYVKDINTLFGDLAKNWSGKPYEDFKAKMTNPRNSINASLIKGQKVYEQLGPIKTMLSQALEAMRKGGSK